MFISRVDKDPNYSLTYVVSAWITGVDNVTTCCSEQVMFHKDKRGKMENGRYHLSVFSK